MKYRLGACVRHSIYVAGVFLAVQFFSSCSIPDGSGESLSGPASTPVRQTDASSGALLDWESATIVLPIDHYAMSPHEALIVEAAGGLEFARCVQQTDDYPQAAVEEAARYIGSTPMANHWKYGFWDANYVARHGYRGIRDDPLMLLIGSSEERNQTCLEQMVERGLSPLSSVNIGDSSGAVLGWGVYEAYEQTMDDPTFLSLQEQWRACVSQGGYVIETDSDSNAAKIDPAWSEEQMLQAAMADAECADSMSYTQQVADIDAAYQTVYIGVHEAELVQTKQVADERVAEAVSILQEAGVL